MLALKIHLPGRSRACLHPKPQMGKEGVPEGVQLKHIQPHRDADNSPPPLLRGVRLQKLLFIVVQIVLGRRAFLLQGLAAAVAGYVPGAVGKGVNGQAAMVLAALAGRGLDLMGKPFQLLRP